MKKHTIKMYKKIKIINKEKSVRDEIQRITVFPTVIDHTSSTCFAAARNSAPFPLVFRDLSSVVLVHCALRHCCSYDSCPQWP